MDPLGFLRRDHDALTRKVAGLIQQLADTNQAQTQAIVAINNKTQRVVTVLSQLATGITVVTVAWPNAWPDTAYGVYLGILPGQANTGLVFGALLNATKAVDQCSIAVNNTSGGILPTVGLDVLGVRT